MTDHIPLTEGYCYMRTVWRCATPHCGVLGKCCLVHTFTLQTWQVDFIA
jgi:hypothetical protein